MHEFVDEVIIGRAGEPPLAQADIIGVVQKLLVVGADVEHDRQAELRMHAGAGGIERELADRDAHAVGAEIAEAEDAFAIGHDDQLGRIGPVAAGFPRYGRDHCAEMNRPRGRWKISPYFWQASPTVGV